MVVGKGAGSGLRVDSSKEVTGKRDGAEVPRNAWSPSVCEAIEGGG